MEIPRDVLLAGLKAHYRTARERVSLPTSELEAEDFAVSHLDHYPNGYSPTVAGIIAAIEAWEARPWGEASPADCDITTGYHATPHRGCILRGMDVAPDIAAERERFARFAEEWIRDGNSVAAIIRQYYDGGATDDRNQ